MKRLLRLWRDLGREFDDEFAVTLKYELQDVLLRALVILVLAIDVVGLAVILGGRS